MKDYENLKKGTKNGLLVTSILCVAMLILLLVNLIRGFISPAPQIMPTPMGDQNPVGIVIPGSVHVILDIVLFVAVIIYAFVGYKKPHGDMLRIIFFGFSIYLLAYACIDFLTKPNYFGNSFVALSALIIAYISGRLNKLEKNRKLLIIVGILLCTAEILSFISNPHQIDLETIMVIICQSSSPIALAALGFAYTARYEEHKAAGLEDNN